MALLDELLGNRTRREIGRLTGICRGTLRGYELGLTKPRADVAQRLAPVVGLSPEEVMRRLLEVCAVARRLNVAERRA